MDCVVKGETPASDRLQGEYFGEVLVNRLDVRVTSRQRNDLTLVFTDRSRPRARGCSALDRLHPVRKS